MRPNISGWIGAYALGHSSYPNEWTGALSVDASHPGLMVEYKEIDAQSYLQQNIVLSASESNAVYAGSVVQTAATLCLLAIRF